jgi:TM2 domain-containing membrane protein YozV
LAYSWTQRAEIGEWAPVELPGEADMAGQGSTGNVIAALSSFFIPGLGQLLQGRLIMAIIQFALASILWFFLLGWVIHLWSVLDAALWKPKQGTK